MNLFPFRSVRLYAAKCSVKLKKEGRPLDVTLGILSGALWSEAPAQAWLEWLTEKRVWRNENRQQALHPE